MPTRRRLRDNTRQRARNGLMPTSNIHIWPEHSWIEAPTFSYSRYPDHHFTSYTHWIRTSIFLHFTLSLRSGNWEIGEWDRPALAQQARFLGGSSRYKRTMGAVIEHRLTESEFLALTRVTLRRQTCSKRSETASSRFLEDFSRVVSAGRSRRTTSATWLRAWNTQESYGLHASTHARRRITMARTETQPPHTGGPQETRVMLCRCNEEY
jgi:hypothetical protein